MFRFIFQCWYIEHYIRFSVNVRYFFHKTKLVIISQSINLKNSNILQIIRSANQNKNYSRYFPWWYYSAPCSQTNYSKCFFLISSFSYHTLLKPKFHASRLCSNTHFGICGIFHKNTSIPIDPYDGYDGTSLQLSLYEYPSISVSGYTSVFCLWVKI